MRHALLLPCILLACSCGETGRKDKLPPLMDYGKVSSVAEVEARIPDGSKIPYQQLFGCSFDTAVKEGKPMPTIDPVFVGGIVEAVRNDPDAGMRCLRKLRGA